MIMVEVADYRNDRIVDAAVASALEGQVRWSPRKSLWFSAMALGWLTGGVLFFSWAAVGVFLLLSAVTLCFGHSLGMHRWLIHRSFTCHPVSGNIGVWLGTLVGLGGPFTMMVTHDMRDWAQRQPACHPFFSHQSGLLRDFWWQIHCKLYLQHTPGFVYPGWMRRSRTLRLIEATGWLSQVLLAGLLFVLGGWGFVFWGVCGRVTISILGHWYIGYRAHNTGGRTWVIEGAAVQGHNVRFAALITFGESWHNSHHAFPGSARIGAAPGQWDPGWWVLLAMERAGLVSDLIQPNDLSPRAERRALPAAGQAARGTGRQSTTAAACSSRPASTPGRRASSPSILR